MNERSPLIKNSHDSSILTRNSISKRKLKIVLPSLEDEKTYKDRYFSIRICYCCMFVSSVSFTICITSMWPFLQLIDKQNDTSFFGWIVAGFSIGQLIASPIFGFWAVKTSNHKFPLITCLFLNIIANFLYAYLQSMTMFDELSPKHWMLIARLVMGIGAACAAIVRSYVSGATNLEERTTVLANISACQGLGFIIGPLLQALLSTPKHYPKSVDTSAFHLNMYTSPAYLSIITYSILLLVVIFKFHEYLMLNQDTEKLFAQNTQNKPINAESYKDVLSKLPQPDRIGVVSSLGLFFICCFVFSFYETLSTPLTIDMYSWTDKQATFYNGLILGGYGVFAVIVVLITKIGSRRFKESLIMAVGYVILFVSAIALLPWGDDYPPVQMPTLQPGHRNVTFIPTQNITRNPEPETRGCPLQYNWCFYTPKIQFYQFMIGFFLMVTGYSIANVMSFTIYSKLLGPWPQGTMMGILTSVGSFARVLGPIIVSYLYGIYGPRVSFIVLAGMIGVAIVIIMLFYKRYVPYSGLPRVVG